MIFNGFYFEEEFLEREDIISKLHLLIELERSDPYANRDTNLTPLDERICTSLGYLPQEHRSAALALFANTLYFPRSFSQSVLNHLMNSFLSDTGIQKEDLGKRCLILEQDPTGIINEFLRHNAVAGRLDKQMFQRTQQVKEFVAFASRSIAENSENTDMEIIKEFLDRDYWVIMADNSLSGTSLKKDFKNLIELAKKEGKDPKYVLLIRTLGVGAKQLIENEFKKELGNKLTMVYGMLLDEKYVINEESRENCRLFNDSKTFDDVLKACKWLVKQEEYLNDPKIKQHRNDSGDNMPFGFKKCGLTFVSSENCPSDSLPLLWYSNPKLYIPPFPRVLSRTK